jgi:hypothetical protein
MEKLVPLSESAARAEEIEFFRDICGWSEDEIERKLGLAPKTLERRRYRDLERARRNSAA